MVHPAQGDEARCLGVTQCEAFTGRISSMSIPLTIATALSVIGLKRTVARAPAAPPVLKASAVQAPGVMVFAWGSRRA